MSVAFSQLPEGEDWIDALWGQLRDDPDPATEHAIRNQLVEHYLPLVRFQAERLVGTLPKSVEVDDMVQEGTFGLQDAIDKFDPERGIKFKTYAGTRIRGAILDWLRKSDWVPRLARNRSNQAERIRQQYLSQHGREPTDQELAEGLDLDVTALKKAQAHSMLSVSDRRTDASDRRNSIDTLSESHQDDPVDTFHRRDLMDVLTRSLSEKERSILQMYYSEGLNLREIGERLSLTESRVCQIHGNVIRRLRERLAESREQFQG